ncbi:unnamed protein product [Mycena citricolor]|uniref:Uncharacterized protein n=1 Tax=Mycena citricolor TaxID=2018698 RepID=A0AAD2Q6B3_9AGAR|nr:unnamed protein product [Mycena citricolor]
MGVWGRTVLLGAAAAYAVWYLFLKSDDEGEVDQAKESGATTGVMRVDATDASGNSLRSEARATYCQFDYYSFEANHCVSQIHSDCDVQSTGLYQSPDNLYPPIPEQFGRRLSKSLPPRRSPVSRAHSQNIGVPPQKSTPLGYPSPTSHCCLPPIGGSDADTGFGHEVFEHEPSNPADAWARIPDEAATYRESARIAREMAASLPKHSTRANELRKLRKKHNVKACQIIFDHNNRVDFGS